MTNDEKQIEGEKSESKLNKQMSPLAGGGVLAGLAFAFVLYRSHDVLRALLAGGVVFALIFWVMWAGQYLERRSKNKREDIS